MENADLAVFMLGTFTAALVTGVAGFAFGLVAAAIWLHTMPPLQATTLIVAYGLLVQAYGVWKLRHILNARQLAPLIFGSAIGIPFGILLLRWTPSSTLRMAVGILLILFSLYNLIRPKTVTLKEVGPAADVGAGVLNGLVGGSTGLAGIVIVVWSSFRNWGKDRQRAAFQPTGVATFLMTLIAIGGSGGVTSDIVEMGLLGLPALAVGTWIGWMLYGKFDEVAFRRVVLSLLLISGAVLLLWPGG